MPLYHTMGIHALTSMAAVNGCFVCQPEWERGAALPLIAARAPHRALPDPHALLRSRARARAHARGVSSRSRKLAYAGAPMLAPLTEACVKAFRPDVFVNHYGSTEIYTFSVRPDVHVKPGCAGRPGTALHAACGRGAATERRVGPDEIVAAGDEGRDHRQPRLRRGLRRLLEPARRGRPGAARRLVLHGRHGLPRRRGRAVRQRAASTT